MEAMRHFQTVTNGQVHLQLPQQFWGKRVEIIVLPALTTPVAPMRKNSLRGGLKQYAKPELIAQEHSAWSAVVSANHEYR